MQLKPLLLTTVLGTLLIAPQLQAKTTQVQPLKIELGKPYPLSYAKTLEQKLNSKRVNDNTAYDCGWIFNDENEHGAYIKNLGLSISEKHAAVTQVIGLNNIQVDYDIFHFNNDFKPSQVKSNHYEISRETGNPVKDFVNIEHSTIKQPYDLVFYIRKKSEDDLVNIYFLNNQIVAVEYSTQC